MPSVLYRIDVQQGNVVTDEMLDKLKQGMTKSQVRFVLGSPLVVDAFRDNRWDYLYIQREKGKLIEQKRMTVYFQDGQLARIENEQLYSVHSTRPKPETAADDAGKAVFDTDDTVGDMKKTIEADDLEKAVDTTEKTVVDPEKAAAQPKKLIEDAGTTVSDDIGKPEDLIEEAADVADEAIVKPDRIVEEPEVTPSDLGETEGTVEKMTSEPEKTVVEPEKKVSGSRKELIIPKRTVSDSGNTVDEATLLRRRPCDSSRPPFHPRMKQPLDKAVLEETDPCFDR